MNNVDTYYGNKIYTIKNFLSAKECDKFIEQIDNKGKTIAFTSVGKFKNDKYVDEKLANSFYEKIISTIDKQIIDRCKIIKANNLIMTGKYAPNQQFGMHTDTGLYFNKKEKLKSRYTLLIYLNDNYEGGETSFYDQKFQHILDIKPQKNMALLFDIDMWHKGKQVLSEHKYWIGCEIIGRF
jgi:prolyl 4-hydroxylase